MVIVLVSAWAVFAAALVIMTIIVQKVLVLTFVMVMENKAFIVSTQLQPVHALIMCAAITGRLFPG